MDEGSSVDSPDPPVEEGKGQSDSMFTPYMVHVLCVVCTLCILYVLCVMYYM